jgi:hypothetical protein
MRQREEGAENAARVAPRGRAGFVLARMTLARRIASDGQEGVAGAEAVERAVGRFFPGEAQQRVGPVRPPEREIFFSREFGFFFFSGEAELDVSLRSFPVDKIRKLSYVSAVLRISVFFEVIFCISLIKLEPTGKFILGNE